MTQIPRFYVHLPNNVYEGPFDLAMILRKISSGKVTADTYISEEKEPTPRKAKEWPEIAKLLQTVSEQSSVRKLDGKLSAPQLIARSLSTGWRFMGQRPSACAMSGLGVVIAYMIGLIVYDFLPHWFAYWLWAIIYLLMQSVVMVMVLRLYRGQYADSEFFSKRMVPAIPRLILFSVVVGTLAAAGLAAMVIPGLLVLSIFMFVPYLLSDKQQDLAQALTNSVSTVYRGGINGFGAMLALVLLNLLSVITIVVLPFTLPLLAAAYADLYDEWVNF